MGKDTLYTTSYSPDLLFAISRKKSRAEYTENSDLTFQGIDIWNAWEFSWLNNLGRPNIAKLTIIFPASSKKYRRI